MHQRMACTAQLRRGCTRSRSRSGAGSGSGAGAGSGSGSGSISMSRSRSRGGFRLVHGSIHMENLRYKISKMLTVSISLSIYVSPINFNTVSTLSTQRHSRHHGHMYVYKTYDIYDNMHKHTDVILDDIESCAYDYSDMYITLVSRNQKNEVVDVLLAHSPQ